MCHQSSATKIASRKKHLLENSQKRNAFKNQLKSLHQIFYDCMLSIPQTVTVVLWNIIDADNSQSGTLSMKALTHSCHLDL